MSEKIIELQDVNPIEIYGVNDVKLEIIRKQFPKLKIIARGDKVKVVGEQDEIYQFEIVIEQVLDMFHKYGTISESNIERILGNPRSSKTDSSGISNSSGAVEEVSDVLVFGNSGLVIKARTPNQRRMVESISQSDMVFAIGPAGTGKTYTAVALAVRALKNKEVKRIVLTRPAVEAGENLGFLPGDLKEKLDPYLQPLYDALYDMIPTEKLNSYIESKVIQIAPLAFMRGRTLDNAFVILDEAQNATESQMKMFLTRMGASAKFVITGDLTQVDLPKNQPSGLQQAAKILNGVEGVDFIYLDGKDVIRHKIVKRIIDVYDRLK